MSEIRFWPKVDVRGEDECWPWKAALTSRGYGYFRYDGGSKAHRFAWRLANGRPPNATEVVRHRCDNPPCVNPAHLEIGSQIDNVHDRDSRDRHARLKGSRHGLTTLSEDQVAEIKGVCRPGDRLYGVRPLARRYGVSSTTIRRIVTGVHWSHVPARADLCALGKGETDG
jgi:hypothetical protein